MEEIFGEVAELYDEVRPGYPDRLLDEATRFHGGQVRAVADLGAGTGKATELLVRLGVPVTAVEPDPRMAAVLAARFPQVAVVTSTFEEWTPPAGGFDLVTCGLAWHWLDERTRNTRTRDALAPGGVLAVFAHKYGYADPAVDRAIGAVLNADGSMVEASSEHWLLEDVEASGVWSGVDERIWHTSVDYTRADYLGLLQTFSPFRRRPPEKQAAALAGLRAVLDDKLTLDLTTTLVLAKA